MRVPRVGRARHYRTVIMAGATLTTDVAPGRPATVVAAGALGVALAVASVVLPYAAYLRRPDLISLVAGLVVIGSGLVLLRNRAVGPAGWLVLGAGYAWFLPVAGGVRPSRARHRPALHGVPARRLARSTR